MKRERPIRQIRILYLYSFLLFLQPLRPCGHLPYIFALQKHPAIQRDTARERLECFVLLRRKLQKLRNVLYSSSSAHECAIGEVSARTEGLKTPSYQSVYTGHLTPLALWALPLYRCGAPRNATGYGRGEGGVHFFILSVVFISLFPLCPVVLRGGREIGETPQKW